MIGNPYHKDANKTRARLVCYTDPYTGDEYEFITNNFRMAPITIANLYKKNAGRLNCFLNASNKTISSNTSLEKPKMR